MTSDRSESNGRAAELVGGELCAICAAAGDCCCLTDTKMAHLSFPLSAPEWRRLAPYSRLASEGCENMPPCGGGGALLTPVPDNVLPPLLQGDAVSSPENNLPDFMESMRTLFPGEGRKLKELFPSEGGHLRLRIRKDGACVFLGEAGCRLPRVVRPWYCRLFPAWVVSGRITFFMSESCHMSCRIKNVEQGIHLLDMPEGDIRFLYSALRADWGLPSSR